MFQAFPSLFCHWNVLPMRGTDTSVPEKASEYVLAKSGHELFATSYGHLNGLFGYHTNTSSKEKAHAGIAPGATPMTSTAPGNNDFHCSHGHMHEDLLRKTAKQIGVKLQGQLAPCQGRLEAEKVRKPVKPVTHARAAKAS